MSKLKEAVEALAVATTAFERGELKSVPYGNQREACLVQSLIALGEAFDLRFKQPLYIDSNGEFSLVVLHPDGRRPEMGCGRYGEEFVKLLNKHRPRTGVTPGTQSADNGWCRINHFDAERMVQEYYTSLQ